MAAFVRQSSTVSESAHATIHGASIHRGRGRQGCGLQGSDFIGAQTTIGIHVGGGEFVLCQVGPGRLQFGKAELAAGVEIDIGKGH